MLLAFVADLAADYVCGKAIECFEQVLAIRRRSMPPNDSGIAKSLDTLGREYSRLGGHGKAVECYEQALEGMRKYLRPDHPDVIALQTTLEEEKSKQARLG